MDGGPPQGLAVGLLGPLRVSIDGRPVELPAGRVRALLAVLAMSAGRPVSLDRLAMAIWGPRPPGDAEANVRTTVRRLRSGLGDGWVGVRPGGYALDVQPGLVDALRFGRLLDEADTAADPVMRRARLSEALDLWRGTPFDGVRSDWLEQALSVPLQERYLAALEQRAELSLAEGVTTGIVAELTELALRHPLRESLWTCLLRSLQLAGRPAEALERYGEIRARLAEDLGVDPGPELRGVYGDLLAGRARTPSPPARVVPRQLPPPVRGFVGRHGELKVLDDERPSLMIATITGTAGVGKTTLAVHWAHLVAYEYPDGQLYADLRGFDPSGRAAAPGEVLRGFLGALRVPPQEVPPEVAQQAALFRSLLAGTRTLVLLDNARDADQVGPLLPGGPGCLVVVTSRDQLTDLVSAHGALPIGLDLLSRDEARELLARRLGHDRTSAEPQAAEEVLDRCARLPLALAIVAARAAVRPDHPLAAFAERLRADGGGLAGVHETLAWSYRTLSPAAARLFRLLGLHPGPDVGAPAAASLAAVPVAEVRSTLAELTRAHLLDEHAPGRYSRHDLLESYAVELAHRHDSEADRRAAIVRVLDHYARTAGAGVALLVPQEDGDGAPHFARADEAVAWFGAEHPVLLAAVELAEREGLDQQLCQLARPLFVFLHRRGLWHERAAVQRAALAAAERLGDRAELLTAHLSLAVAAADLRWYDEAYGHLDQAWELAGAGERAWVLQHRSLVAALEGNAPAALVAAAGARDLYRAAGNGIGYASALTDVGWYLGRLGHHELGAAMLEEALSRHEAHDNIPYQAHSWSCLGDIHLRAGDRARSIDCYRKALDLFRRTGDRYAEATTLAQAGAGWYAAGDLEAARDAWRQARRLLDDLDPAAAYQAWDQLRLIDERAAEAFRAL